MSKHARFSATVVALRFAPDGQELWGVTAAGEGWRWAWAMEPQATIRTGGSWERPQSIVDVVWAADGRAVALVDGAGALWLWYPVDA